MYILFTLVFFFQCLLHGEIELTFALDSLLLQVADNTLVHGLLLRFLLEMNKDNGASSEERGAEKGQLGSS